MKLAFIDVETTGSSPVYDRIIEVGIIRVENNKITETYQTLINPETYLNPYITQITGITSDQLEDAPTFSQVKDNIYDLLDECTFVAHNARFDYGFIKNELKRFNIQYQAKTMCTVKLSRQLFPQYKRHSLDSLIERFHFSCENRHRALDDARVMYDFFQLVQKQFPTETVQDAIDRVMKKTYLPASLAQNVLEEIPESPGVYIFYSDEELPLYVGKSINMRERVQSHFSTDLTSSRKLDMCQQIKSIKTIPTIGELGALLLESSLIKKMYPVYNRQLRISSKLVVAEKRQNRNGYFTADLETVDRVKPEYLSKILTIARSKRQAKEYLDWITKEYSLCPKLNGLEKASGACFYHKLGTCQGACIGKESPIKYNIRFLEAFSEQVIRPWPYKGPIMIQERDDVSGVSEGFVIDQWCYLGKVRWEDDLLEKELSNDYTFDLDIYKILNRFLKNPSYSRKIKQISKDDLLDRSN